VDWSAGPKTNRRTRQALIALLCAVAAVAHPASSSAALNPIQLENAKPGTSAWNLPGDTATAIATPSNNIEGYASEISVAPGDVLDLHVSTTPAAPYRVELYRLGWYQGLGGRLIACLPSCGASENGTTQPVPSPDPNTGYLDAGWSVTDSIAVGSDWTTGYYVAKLVLTGGPDNGQASWVPFIVRDPAGASSAILVQASVNTWEAYNNWGGKSLYVFNSTGPVVPASSTVAAAMVSFNRPFGTDINSGPFTWEVNVVRYVERQGYDVSYQTDVDTDQSPSSLLSHRLDIVSGHDEYWSQTTRNAYEAARNAGVNLAFLGGNIGYWQIRYADSSDRTLIEYRSASLDPDPNPSQKTVPFSAPPVNRPECQLLGVGYPGGLAVAGDPARSYSVTPAATSNPWFSGTGFSAGDTIYDSVGYEWDMIQPGCAVPPLQVLLHFAGLPGAYAPNPADAVTYTASSGAQVFSDGSMQMAWALDDFGHPPHADARVQRLFANILDALGAPPGSIGATQLVQPGPGAVTRSPVVFSWTNPTGTQTYQLTIDGNVARTVNASTCSATLCTASVALPDGHHTWSVQAADAQGDSASTQPVTFLVDTAPPDQFALRSPRPGSVLWSPRPRLTWTASRDSDGGLVAYEVVIDGKLIGRTTATSYNLADDLTDGRHIWSVVAVDPAGNQRATSTRRFFVRSVRLVARSRAHLLAHGFTLRVYCIQRCTIRVRLRLGSNGPATSVVRRSRRSGIATVPVPLSRPIQQRLTADGSALLHFTARTRAGHAVRTVVLVTRM
jgi:hypothetical protein